MLRDDDKHDDNADNVNYDNVQSWLNSGDVMWLHLFVKRRIQFAKTLQKRLFKLTA